MGQKGTAFSLPLKRVLFMLGILFIVFSSIIYGIDPTIRQTIIEGGVSPMEEIAFGYAFSTVLAAGCCLVRHKPLLLKPRVAGQLPLVGCVGSGACTILLVNAYQFISVGCATMIHCLYPAIVCVVMAILYKRRMTGVHIVAIALSAAGLVCVSQSALCSSAVGVLLAAASSFAYAYYIVAMDNTSIRSLPIETRAFYTSACGTLVSLFILAFTKPSHAFTLKACAILAVCVTFSMASSCLFLAGLRRIGSTMSAFLSLLEPIVSIITSAVVFRNALSPVMLFGCLLILTAIVFINLGNRPSARPPARTKE